jgi:hypothetical protein
MQDTELEFVELYDPIRGPRGPKAFQGGPSAHFGVGPNPSGDTRLAVIPYLRIGHPAGTLVVLKDAEGGAVCVPWHHVKDFREKAVAAVAPEEAKPEAAPAKPPPPGPPRMKEEPHTLKV